MTLTGSGRSSTSRALGPTFHRSEIAKDPICFSPYLYRARNLVERFFNKIKHCRRIATRYDKLAANYLAFVELASIRLWLRVYEFTTEVPAAKIDFLRSGYSVVRKLQSSPTAFITGVIVCLLHEGLEFIARHSCGARWGSLPSSRITSTTTSMVLRFMAASLTFDSRTHRASPQFRRELTQRRYA